MKLTNGENPITKIFITNLMPTARVEFTRFSSKF